MASSLPPSGLCPCALLPGPNATTPFYLNRTPFPSSQPPAPSPVCLRGRCLPPLHRSPRPASTPSREAGMVSCVPTVSPGWVRSRCSAQSRMDEGWTYLDTEGKHVTHSLSRVGSHAYLGSRVLQPQAGTRSVRGTRALGPPGCRKCFSREPLEAGAPRSAPRAGHTHSCVCPRAWPVLCPRRPVMYIRPPRKLQKMS